MLSVLTILYKFFFFQPEKVKFELKLGQSLPIYNAFKDIKESSNWDTLSEARKRIVECKYYIVSHVNIFLILDSLFTSHFGTC